MLTKIYCPSSPVEAVLDVFVAGSERVTVAPTMAAPVESVTVPRSEEVEEVCAAATLPRHTPIVIAKASSRTKHLSPGHSA
jgi:hypothetical protein